MVAAKGDRVVGSPPGGGKSMLFLGPFLGLAYVVLLPFIAIGAFIGLAAGKIFSALSALVGRGILFGWRPSTAYLAGKKKEKKQRKED